MIYQIRAVLKKGMKKFVILAAMAVGLSSCNTMIGMGRDFRQLGQGMEHKAHGRNFDGSEPAPEENLPTY
ncbi:entericidin [Haloferula helveola]|uniref:Entericidin n=2 Tax=Haloferula helveola TaxID=490095 RepID=A0ABN6H1B8_9BACT|nr:entericidin [Haloferula helveola]